MARIEALTRKVGSKYYNLSAHLVWIGDRTRQVAPFFRGRWRAT